MAQQKNAYSASSITVLEGLEAVRKRPGMYIGSTGERGLHHLIWEVVDNAVDEAMAGYATRVEVTLQDDGGVRVVDDGRGIPVDMHPVEKRPAVEMVLTMLHAGGKFDSDSYAVSGGLHGVGVSVVNALSTALDVEIHRDGTVWRQHYARSVPGPLRKGEATTRTGSTVTFWADPASSRRPTYNIETIRRRLQEMAFLNKGLTIVLRDERNGDSSHEAEEPDAEGFVAKVQEYTFCYPGGLEDFVAHLNKSKDPIHKKLVSFSGEGDGHAVEVAMQWNSGYTESVYTFANTINTHEGGTHEEGFRSALTTTVNRYARDKKLLKEKDPALTGDDIREGLAAIVSVKVKEPQFEGQTKTKLGNTEVKSFVQRVSNEWLADWLERNPTEAKIDREQGGAVGAGPGGRAQGPRAGAPQERRRHRRAARQAGRLPLHRPGRVRGLHRRGRLGRRLGQVRPRLDVPGDPADPRQDHQRGEGPDRPRPQEHRGPGDHHRAGHRHPRRVRPGQAALPQDRADGRRRRRRPAHPHPAAHPAVPVHAAAGRARARVPGPAPALQDQVGRPGRRAGVRLHRPRARRPARGRPRRRARSCPRKRASSATRASAR